MSGATRVYVEVGGKKAFAVAADWPGWARAGKSEQAALEALAAYAPRYAKVAKLPSDATRFEVIERLKGNATTDFGAPAIQAKADARRLAPKDAERMLGLLEACWMYLDKVRARVPQELRKGPRGGGRDRDKMYGHVVEAELGYAGAIGLKMKSHDREALLEALRHPVPGAKWPAPFAIRRMAWHALDHAWEMEDRIP